MQPHRRRTKKLAVAFHFQFSNQTAWKCDVCRSKGLEQTRACKWVDGLPESPRAVWARSGVSARRCPKSVVTAESLDWIERFYVGRAFGFGDILGLPARDVEAFCLLERQMNLEKRREQE